MRKLKKKFKVKCVQQERQKNNLFLVLSGMELKDEDDSISSTCTRVEMIDREGLCRVNNDTYKLMEQIEVVTRHYLQSDYQPCGQAIQQQIISSVLSNKPILSRCLLPFFCDMRCLV